MAQLTTDTVRSYELGELNDLPAIAATTIYEGSAVGDNGSGFARQLVAGDPFRGFADAKCDNAAGAAGDKNVRLKATGCIVLAVASAAITDVGKPVYASDGNTFVLTLSTNSYIGRVVRFISTGVVVVEFDAAKGTLGTMTELTDSSGGTASDTIADVPGSYTEATLANQLASIIAKVNGIIRQIK